MSIRLADIDITAELGDALSLSFGMSWEILWALILGFAISAAVQAVVSKAPTERACSLEQRAVFNRTRRSERPVSF
jgi:hypothetical protein